MCKKSTTTGKLYFCPAHTLLPWEGAHSRCWENCDNPVERILEGHFYCALCFNRNYFEPQIGTKTLRRKPKSSHRRR